MREDERNDVRVYISSDKYRGSSRLSSSSGVISVSCKQDEDAMDVVNLYAIIEYTCRLRETRTNYVKTRHVILPVIYETI